MSAVVREHDVYSWVVVEVCARIKAGQGQKKNIHGLDLTLLDSASGVGHDALGEAGDALLCVMHYFPIH
jgi:hypothetical protein